MLFTFEIEIMVFYADENFEEHMGITEADKSKFKIFEDEDHRLYLGNSAHDMEHGVYVSGVDKAFFDIEDNTLLYGNLQAEDFFDKYKDKLRDWLKVKPEYESHEYTKENL